MKRVWGTTVLAATAIWAMGAAPAGASSNAHTSVIGGRPASIADFPSLAYVLDRGHGRFGGYSCTGTVVAPRVVLTAAHCVEEIDSLVPSRVGDLRVVTGSADVDDPPDVDLSTVTADVVFPGFNPAKALGDAGLMILDRPVSAKPISLASPAAPVPLSGGTPLQLAGWGITDFITQHAPSVLHAGRIDAQTPAYCEQHSSLLDPFYSASLQICGADLHAGKVSGCYGDSGGPAIATRPDGTQAEVGIVSQGSPRCLPEEASVFTRVEAVAEWVQGWIAAVETGAPAPAEPEATLPRMTVFKAAAIDRLTLFELFPGSFSEASDPHPRCRSLSRAKVRCDWAWDSGSGGFRATLTSFWAIERNQTLLRGSYVVRSATRRCLSGPHPRSCPVHTIRG
jgi:secreted trypsin-like serine protease